MFSRFIFLGNGSVAVLRNVFASFDGSSEVIIVSKSLDNLRTSVFTFTDLPLLAISVVNSGKLVVCVGEEEDDDDDVDVDPSPIPISIALADVEIAAVAASVKKRFLTNFIITPF